MMGQARNQEKMLTKEMRLRLKWMVGGWPTDSIGKLKSRRHVLWRHAWSPRTSLSSSAQAPAGLSLSLPETDRDWPAPGGPPCDRTISSPSLVPMASRPSRPLPTPPGPVNPLGGPDHSHIYSLANPYRTPLPRPPYTPLGLSLPVDDEPPTATLRGGTLLHKGFYDLLALIPTPSPSRFLWAAGADPAPDALAGPRYEDLPELNDVPPVKFAPPTVKLPSPGPVSPKKGKRISKDMVSKPMGFVYVCDHCTSPSLASTLGQPFSACI